MDDYRVKPLSDRQIRELAKYARKYCGVSDHRSVDILACLAQRTIWTCRGVEQLNFQVRPDDEMGRSDGSTAYSSRIVTITIKQSIRDQARVGVGRARNTCAHEYGHGVMHHGPPLHRRFDHNVTPKWLLPFESAEHQAKVFAPSFLVNDAFASTLKNAEELAIESGVSLESAEIYFNYLNEDRSRAENAERMQQIARNFRDSTTPPKNQLTYSDKTCPSCGQQTLIPIGIKFLCHTCENVIDRFPDGDAG
jgi:hypothetical protein